MACLPQIVRPLGNTQAGKWLDLSINGMSSGRFRQTASCTSGLGAPTIFASGDEALAGGTQYLASGIKTVGLRCSDVVRQSCASQ